MSRPEDFRDDFDIPPSRSGLNPTSAGMIGFVFALVAVALLAVVGVLWYLLRQQAKQAQAPDNAERWMMVWFLFLDALSLGAGIAAVVFGARSLSRTNPLYRGYGVTALILGIIEIAGTLFFGCFITCCGVLFGG
jgi:hypothetical protein